MQRDRKRAKMASARIRCARDIAFTLMRRGEDAERIESKRRKRQGAENSVLGPPGGNKWATPHKIRCDFGLERDHFKQGNCAAAGGAGIGTNSYVDQSGQGLSQAVAGAIAGARADGASHS